MNARATAATLLAIAVAAGTAADRAPTETLPRIAGYRVIAADFHVHPVLTAAWDLVLEAQRRHLDAIAITPHNQIASARIGRWFSQLVGGPIVLVGEEIRQPRYHLIAFGIDEPISWNQPAALAIDAVHRQNGIAIAAHPEHNFWDAYDAAAMKALDGSEVMHPEGLVNGRARRDFERFFERARRTAIGSSDYHGLAPMGTCRTYVFATDATEPAILDAIRAGRTVVYGDGNRVYGDPDLIRAASGQLPGTDAVNAPRNQPLVWISRLAGVVGLLLLITTT